MGVGGCSFRDCITYVTWIYLREETLCLVQICKRYPISARISLFFVSRSSSYIGTGPLIKPFIIPSYVSMTLNDYRVRTVVAGFPLADLLHKPGFKKVDSEGNVKETR